MHFFRDNKNRVYLQAYNPQLKRNEKLSREESKHFDAMSDDEIRKALEGRKSIVTVAQWYLNDPVRKHFERWLEHLRVEERLDTATVRQHQTYVERYVFEYFADVVKKKDPNNWPAYSARFYTWMKTEGYKVVAKDPTGKPKLLKNGQPQTVSVPASPSVIRAANVSYRKFFGWMGEEGLVTPVDIKLRAPTFETKHTKLPRTIAPDEVLEWARKCSVPHVRLCGLMGYFLSLRPQETFAAVELDFQSGKPIANLEAVKVMREIGLYDGLAFMVHRQKQNSGDIVEHAKSNSEGWVACFNKDGAKLIVDTVLELDALFVEKKKNRKVDPNKSLVKWNNRKLYEDWKKFGLRNIDLKDLRRASLYFLGLHTGIQPLQLMKHARHANIETTMLYCRRPREVAAPRAGRLKLED